MFALTVRPGKPDSARLETVANVTPNATDVLVRTLAVGVCGTDREIIAGEYGTAPAGQDYLVLGHESLGEVLEAPSGSGFSGGDLVVGIVRRRDPVPCDSCAAGEWDMCRNGLYTEHGIRGLDGFCRETFLIEPEYLVKLDPSLGGVGILTEPASILAKAWEHIQRIGHRAAWEPSKVLVTGAGPIGLLGAMIGVQLGLEVHVLDLVTEGPKPDLVRALGAEYHVGDFERACSEADIVLECTGVGQLVFDVMRCTAPGGIVCLTGITSGGRALTVDFAALNQSMVLENDVVFGTVNANRRHYEAAAAFLKNANRGWLERLVTRRVPLARWPEAVTKQPHDVKTIIEIARRS
jgi:threonine dehydrogenase-like Zn-dependent dehydrogenase